MPYDSVSAPPHSTLYALAYHAAIDALKDALELSAQAKAETIRIEKQITIIESSIRRSGLEGSNEQARKDDLVDKLCNNDLYRRLHSELANQRHILADGEIEITIQKEWCRFYRVLLAQTGSDLA